MKTKFETHALLIQSVKVSDFSNIFFVTGKVFQIFNSNFFVTSVRNKQQDNVFFWLCFLSPQTFLWFFLKNSLLEI